MYVLCIVDVQPGFEESKFILEPVLALVRQAMIDGAMVVVAQFKHCGEYPISFDYPFRKVWHTKKDRIQAIRRVLPIDPSMDPLEIRIAGLYTDLFVKDIVRALSRDHPVKVLSHACYGKEEALDQMKTYKNVTVL
jgi:hypothetical protein